jgi:hypothetical protein
MCVPVVKAATREAGRYGDHGHGAGVLKSPDAVVRKGVAGSVNGGSRVGSTHRGMVVRVA